MKKTVALGFLGTRLDERGRKGPFARWRPTIAMCQQPDMAIDRLELIANPQFANMADQVIEDIAIFYPKTDVRLHVIEQDDPWDFAEIYTKLLDFANAYPFNPEREDYLVNMTTGTHVAQICWFLLTEARYVPAKLLQLSPTHQSQDQGNDAYRGTYKLIDLDLSRYDLIAKRYAVERQAATSFLKSGIETRNEAFNAMIDQIEKVAIRSTAPVLLTGPTGAGKSQLARRIFELKKSRRQVTGAFVEVNCATLRGDQAMSTLFGHAKGAFTGAQAARQGLMKAADQGVLFLDEIGELGLDEQAICLRALEEKRFLPLGSDRDVQSDFQLLAGTNRDLSVDVREGRFREDLFARLNLWSFAMPALSARREDIEPNLDYELQRYGDAEGRKVTFNKEARRRFLAFALSDEAVWKANFRDLSASVTRMATFSPEGRIDERTVVEEIDRLRGQWGAITDRHAHQEILRGLLAPDRLADIDLFDQPQLAQVIETCRASTSLSEAGRTLFAASRRHKKTGNDADRLRKYLLKFDLNFEAVQG
ncbi:MAG: RNA repair transcriptional activator RtcR [Pseudomonadota bacterium]